MNKKPIRLNIPPSVENEIKEHHNQISSALKSCPKMPMHPDMINFIYKRLDEERKEEWKEEWKIEQFRKWEEWKKSPESQIPDICRVIIGEFSNRIRKSRDGKMRSGLSVVQKRLIKLGWFLNISKLTLSQIEHNIQAFKEETNKNIDTHFIENVSDCFDPIREQVSKLAPHRLQKIETILNYQSRNEYEAVVPIAMHQIEGITNELIGVPFWELNLDHKNEILSITNCYFDDAIFGFLYSECKFKYSSRTWRSDGKCYVARNSECHGEVTEAYTDKDAAQMIWLLLYILEAIEILFQREVWNEHLKNI